MSATFIKPKNFYQDRSRIVIKRIESERKRQGIQQKQLAARCGMGPGNLCKVESGFHSVTLMTLLRLADGLGVCPSTLLRGVIKPMNRPSGKRR